MKRILTFCFLLSALFSRAANPVGIFDTGVVWGQPLTNVLVEYMPLSAVFQSNRVIALIPFTNRTDAAGRWVTNLVPGAYRVTIRHPQINTPFTNCVPDTADTIYLMDPQYICGATNQTGSGLFAYTRTASDARYVQKLNSGATNLSLRWTGSVASAGQVWTARDTNGGGAWSNVTGGASSGDLITTSNALFLTLTNYDAISSNALFTALTNRIAITSNGLVGVYGPQVAGLSNAVSGATNFTLQTLTNSQNLSINPRGLTLAYGHLATNTTEPFTILGIGDTLPYFSGQYVGFTQNLGEAGFVLPYGSKGYNISGAATNRIFTEGLAVATNFPVYTDLGSNGVYMSTNYTGAFGGCDYGNRMEFYAIRDASGGTATLFYRTNGGTGFTNLGTLATSGTIGLAWTNFPVLPGYYQCVISNGATGLIKPLGVGMQDTNSTGVRVVSLIYGNLDTDDIGRNCTNVSLPFLRVLSPKLAYVSEISGAENWRTNADRLANFLTNAMPAASIAVIGAWNGNWAWQAHGAQQRQFGIDKNITVLSTCATCATTDGVHLTDASGEVASTEVTSLTALGEAVALARARRPLSGQFPLRGADNVWGGDNTFMKAPIFAGAGGGVVLGDRSLGPLGTDTARRATISYDNGIFGLNLDGGNPQWRFSNLIGDSRFSPWTASGSKLGSAALPWASLELTAGDVGTNLAARAPYAATTLATNAVQNTNSVATNLTARSRFVVTNGVAQFHSDTIEHTFTLNTNTLTDPAAINVMAVQHKSTGAASAIRFNAYDFSSTNNREMSAVGYGNHQAAPYGEVTYLASSDLFGPGPTYTPTNLVPIRLIQYGTHAGTAGDNWVVLDSDTNANVNFWSGTWGSKVPNLFVRQGGGVSVGTTNHETEAFRIGSQTATAFTRFYADGATAAMNTVSNEQIVSHFKDATPSKAWSIGSAAIGAGRGDDWVLNFYNGSAWAERVRVLNANGNVGIGTTTPGEKLTVAGNVAIATNLFVTNNITVSGTANIRTNIATVDVTTNLFVLGTRYTNSARRMFVTASAQLSAAAAGTAKVSLYVEYATSITNKVSISAGPLASLVTVEQLSQMIGPSAIYYFTDETSGVGAAATIVADTCSRTEL